MPILKMIITKDSIKMHFNRLLVVIKVFVILFFMSRIFLAMINECIPGALEYPLGSMDFKWDAAKLYSEHINPNEESLFRNHPGAERYSEYYEEVSIEEFPSMTMLLLPYTVFDPVQAKMAWLISNMVFLILLIVCLRNTVFSELNNLDAAIWCLILGGSIPVRDAFIMGQHLIFSLSFFMLSVYLSELGERYNRRKLTYAAGIILGLSYFKYSVIFGLALFFIYKKWFVQIIESIALHVILMIFSAFWLKTSFIDAIVYSLRYSIEHDSGSGYMDLMKAFETYGLCYYPVFFVLVALLFIITVRRKDDDSNRMLSLYSLFSIILLYHHEYDYFVLIIPLFYFANSIIKNFKTYNPVVLIIQLTGVLAIWFIMWHDVIISHLGIHYGGEVWGGTIYNIMHYGLWLLAFYLLVLELHHTFFERKKA